MTSLNRRQFLGSAMLGAGGGFLVTPQVWAELPPGVETKALPYISSDERFSQPNLWVLEVNFKPLRMITVNLPDAKTGTTTPRLISYLCYRVLNRPIQHRHDKGQKVVDKTDSTPLFLPEFTLVTDDNTPQKIYIDRVMPVAQAAIEKRERHKYKNSVEIKGPIPAVTSYDSKADNAVYGVATWRGVDPTTDRFTIFMAGFSNGYEVKKGPNGEDVVLQKTLVQKFSRFGDEFEQHEKEFTRVGPPKWIYR